MRFIIVQLFGLIGFLFLLVSYWHKDINKIVLLHVFSGIFYIIHYLMLGATAGLLVIIFDIIRDFLYYKTNSDKIIFLISVPIYAVSGYFVYNSLISLFPILASLTEGYNLAYKEDAPIMGAIIASSLWLIYDFVAGSYISIIPGIIMLVSDIIVLIKGPKIAE